MSKHKYVEKKRKPSLSERDELGLLNLDIDVPKVVQDAIDELDRVRKTKKNFRTALVDREGYLTPLGEKIQVAIAYCTSKDMGVPDEDQVDAIEIDVPTKEEATDIFEYRRRWEYNYDKHKFELVNAEDLPKRLVRVGNKQVEIRDTSNPNKYGHTEEKDVADIWFGDGARPYQALKKMILDMNADKQRYSAMEELLNITFKDISTDTQNGFINSDVHIGNYAQGSSYKKKNRFIEQEERVMRSWRGIKNSYEWLMDSTDLESKIFLETGMHLEYNRDNPRYWFEVSKYMNDSRYNGNGVQQYASEEYGLGDFFGEVRDRDASNQAVKWHDLTSQEKKDLYVRYSRGEDISLVTSKEKQIKINSNLQGILNRSNQYNEYIRNMKKNRKKKY